MTRSSNDAEPRGVAPVIDVREVECRYGDTTILRDVSFSVNAGELFFIAGRNGSGKSTLLRHMIGLMVPARGTVRYFGKEFPYRDRLEQRGFLKSFGVLYQSGALWSSMTVGENIELPLREFTSLDRRERRQLVALKLAQVGLSGTEDLSPSELSGGMRRRAAFARALALDPPIVFFDEPSAGLDPVTAHELDRLILEMRDALGTTMVIVSHSLESIHEIADRVILIDREEKTVIADGAPDEVVAETDDERVKRFFDPDATEEKREGSG